MQLELPEEAVIAKADRDSVKQIVFNLWKNAAEALQPGGQVVTSVAAQVNQNGRSYAELCIDDNGPGLPADVMQQLYQPLGSQRQAGRSGLGLSIVRSLVDKLDGQITCRSRAGQGTRFAVLLPEPERPESERVVG